MSIDEEVLVLIAPQTDQTFQLNPTSKKAVPGGPWIAFFSRSKTALHDRAELKIAPFPLEEGNSAPFGTEIPFILGAFAKEQLSQDSPFSHEKNTDVIVPRTPPFIVHLHI